jgi:hypothetical protein
LLPADANRLSTDDRGAGRETGVVVTQPDRVCPASPLGDGNIYVIPPAEICCDTSRTVAATTALARAAASSSPCGAIRDEGITTRQTAP